MAWGHLRHSHSQKLANSPNCQILNEGSPVLILLPKVHKIRLREPRIRASRFVIMNSVMKAVGRSRFRTADHERCHNSCVVQPRCCIMNLVWEVNIEYVELWLDELDQDTYEQVVAALELLAERGPQLGRPLVDAVKTSRHKNMKELRPGSKGRSELRILFAFDVERNGVLLVAGDKSGDWKKWYEVNVPVADDKFDEHVRRLKGE